MLHCQTLVGLARIYVSFVVVAVFRASCHPARQLPASFAVAPPPSESIAAGIRAMVDMVASPYDDVAVNGCASVAKLAASCSSTSLRMASSVALLQALVDVVSGFLSLDTVTNAALALAVLTEEPIGQTLLATQCTTKDGVPVAKVLADKAAFPADGVEAEYQVLCFRRYW
jgi:hypothetical protein